MARMAARHRASGGPIRVLAVIVACVVLAIAAAVAVVVVTRHSSALPRTAIRRSVHRTALPPRATTTTSSAPPTTTTSTLPAPAAGFLAGHVTAVGDSVMIDYETPLQADIPGVDIEATVSRQWGAGEALLAQLKSEGRTGAEVIVALSTNGPIATADFDAMMTALQGASRIVFVNTHVDRPWQDPNNAILAQGAARYPRVVVADWNTLAAANPQWFGSDGTHLAINGPGATALASLITTTLEQP
jgi:hypothetical protein